MKKTGNIEVNIVLNNVKYDACNPIMPIAEKIKKAIDSQIIEGMRITCTYPGGISCRGTGSPSVPRGTQEITMKFNMEEE